MHQTIVVILISGVLSVANCIAQDMADQLNSAMQKLSTDAQFKHATISLYVVDSKTGKVIFDKNSQVGLAPASCQKIITSVSAFEILGKGFRFRTYIGHDLSVSKSILQGNLYLTGRGDPTLGSDRWYTTSAPVILKKILTVLQKNNIKGITGDLVCDDSHFTDEPLPNGWIWEDIGNYYGAGAWGLNWQENQFDVTFTTGKIKDEATRVVSTNPPSMLADYIFANFVSTGEKGSGDNAYLFSSPFQKNIIARGTVPVSSNGFTISGAMPDPPGIFIKRLNEYLKENGTPISGDVWTNSGHLVNNQPARVAKLHLDSILSPPLDSINYWFLKKSVNLYGEALVKMIGYQSTGKGLTDAGIALVKEFWTKKGIEKSALKMIDGSGLSPANRITTHSLVTALQFAKSRSWFTSFFNALPEMNGIKMKDGYIGGVRSYVGYTSGKSGRAYTFAFIINNFDGSAATVRDKMWKILSIINN